MIFSPCTWGTNNEFEANSKHLEPWVYYLKGGGDQKGKDKNEKQFKEEEKNNHNKKYKILNSIKITCSTQQISPTPTSEFPPLPQPLPQQKREKEKRRKNEKKPLLEDGFPFEQQMITFVVCWKNKKKIKKIVIIIAFFITKRVLKKSEFPLLFFPHDAVLPPSNPFSSLSFLFLSFFFLEEPIRVFFVHCWLGPFVDSWGIVHRRKELSQQRQ